MMNINVLITVSEEREVDLIVRVVYTSIYFRIKFVIPSLSSLEWI